MNKIVREHYPAARLPAELREGLPAGASVRVIVEEETRKTLSREELLQTIRQAQARARGTSLEEAVTRIGALRDEWED